MNLSILLSMFMFLLLLNLIEFEFDWNLISCKDFSWIWVLANPSFWENKPQQKSIFSHVLLSMTVTTLKCNFPLLYTN